MGPLVKTDGDGEASNYLPGQAQAFPLSPELAYVCFHNQYFDGGEILGI
jgi:hypothetical protein